MTRCCCAQEAFSAHINYVLADDAWLTKSGVLPIDPTTMGLFDAVKDGILVWYAGQCLMSLHRSRCVLMYSHGASLVQQACQHGGT